MSVLYAMVAWSFLHEEESCRARRLLKKSLEFAVILVDVTPQEFT